MIAKTKLLAQIAGGAEKGTVWHANFDPKEAHILEHYRMTLDKVKGQQIDTAREAAQKAYDEVEKTDRDYRGLCEKGFFREGIQKQRADERAAQHHKSARDEDRGLGVQVVRSRRLQDGHEVPVAGGFGEAGEGELHGRRVTRDDWEAWVQADLVKLVKLVKASSSSLRHIMLSQRNTL